MTLSYARIYCCKFNNGKKQFSFPPYEHKASAFKARGNRRVHSTTSDFIYQVKWLYVLQNARWVTIKKKSNTFSISNHSDIKLIVVIFKSIRRWILFTMYCLFVVVIVQNAHDRITYNLCTTLKKKHNTNKIKWAIKMITTL